MVTEINTFYTPPVAADLRAEPILLFERILGERQSVRIGDHVGGRVVGKRPARRNAALRQERALGQADLHRVESEDIGHGLIEVRLLARKQVRPQVRGEPLGQRR